MKLNEYIQTFPRQERTKVIQKIAIRLGIKTTTVRSMIAGVRLIQGEYAIPLDKITNGKVPCHETCPKLYPKPYNWRCS